jgi:hypothetical protein
MYVYTETREYHIDSPRIFHSPKPYFGPFTTPRIPVMSNCLLNDGFRISRYNSEVVNVSCNVLIMIPLVTHPYVILSFGRYEAKVG